MSTTTTPAMLITEAALQGLVVEAHGDRLRVLGPDAIRARWMPAIKEHKPALLAYLRQCQQPGPGLRQVGDYTAAVVTDAALGRPAESSDLQNGGAIREPQNGGAGIGPHSDESAAHDCHACMHWLGVETVQLVTRDGIRIGVRGACAAGFRPWRISNIPSQLDFYRWHHVGQCAEQQEDNA